MRSTTPVECHRLSVGALLRRVQPPPNSGTRSLFGAHAHTVEDAREIVFVRVLLESEAPQRCYFSTSLF